MLKRVSRAWRSSVAAPTRIGAPGTILAPTLVRRAGALIVFILLWQLVTMTGLVKVQIVPSPLTVFASFLDLTLDWSDFARHNLQLHIPISAALSVARVAVGLTIGIVVGVAVGYLIGWYPLWGFPADFVVRTLRSIPAIAWVPLAISWFGVAFLGPIFIVSLSAFFPIAIATQHGVRTVNPVYIQSLRTLGADDGMILRDVILPGAVPSILTGARVGLTIGWWSLIGAEMFGAPGGLGFIIKYHGDVVRMPEVMAGMIAVGMISFMLDRGYTVAQRRLLAWQGSREGLRGREG